MKPLDKKQVPQVVALAVLALLFFGYFAVKMIMPTPAAAGTHAAPAPAATTTAPPKTGTAQAAADPSATPLAAPPPSAGLRDPFVQAISDQPAPPSVKPQPAPVRTAALNTAAHPSIPPAPVVPPFALSGLTVKETTHSAAEGFAHPIVPVAPPLPVAAPAWVVTGVLQSGTDRVAILRSGEARRFVKQGEFVDSTFRVTSVTRDAVVLKHGTHQFTLPLGGAKAIPAAHAAASPVAPVAPVVPVIPATPAAPDAANAAPEMSRAIRPSLRTRHAPRHTLVAVAPRSLFSGPAFALPQLTSPKLTLPLGHRPASCPTVRVADYQSGQTGVLFPSQGHGPLSCGIPAPDFSLSSLDGQGVTLSQFQGRVVVLGFWASWDAASLKTLTWLQWLQNQVGHDRLTVLAVNSWDSKGAMQAALQGMDWNMTMLFDPSVSNTSVAVRDYHASDIPAFYVIDQEGRIAGSFVGSGRNTTNSVKATLAKLGVL